MYLPLTYLSLNLNSKRLTVEAPVLSVQDEAWSSMLSDDDVCKDAECSLRLLQLQTVNDSTLLPLAWSCELLAFFICSPYLKGLFLEGSSANPSFALRYADMLWDLS